MGAVKNQGQGGLPEKVRDQAVELSGLRLMRVGLALALVAVAAVGLLAGVVAGGLALFGVQGLKAETQVSAATLFDLLKIAFAMAAGLGGLVALVVAYRRQKVAEAAHWVSEQSEERARRSEQREATKLHNDRFTTATGQLGHDSPAVRLASVHALAGLADDAPTRELRQTCIDVLCAYLRMPYTPKPADDAPEADRLMFAGLREVRHTIIRLITAHLRVSTRVSWQGYDLDLSSVVFDGGDFSDAVFSGGTVSFHRARFSEGTTSFRNATFSGSTISFRSAQFLDGTISFRNATFSDGEVLFRNANFSGGRVLFANATFSGSNASFARATFAGSIVSFVGATFAEGEVSFVEAEFSNGAVGFSRAHFTARAVSFHLSRFAGGTVDMRDPSSWDLPPFSYPAPPHVLLPTGWKGTEAAEKLLEGPI